MFSFLYFLQVGKGTNFFRNKEIFFKKVKGVGSNDRFVIPQRPLMFFPAFSMAKRPFEMHPIKPVAIGYFNKIKYLCNIIFYL